MICSPIKVQKRDRKQVTEKALALLTRVGLADYANVLPSQVSGGQKQRAAIVRCLCMDPKLILLDEVTASLDPEMVREVLQVILDLAKSRVTMIIVTHELSFAQRVSDRILFMEEGQILADEPAEKFFLSSDNPRVKTFLNSHDYSNLD